MSFRAKVSVVLAFILAVVATSIAAGLFFRFQSPVPIAFAAVQREPSVAELRTQADAYLKSRQTEQALLLFRQAEARDSTAVDTHLDVARAELAAGRETEAAAEYERVLKHDPDNTRALLQLGTIHSQRSITWRLAQVELKRYIELQPNDAEAQLRLARLLMAQEEWARAAEVYALPPVVRLSTDQDRKQYIYALLNSGQRDRAETALRQALSAGKLDFDLRLQLAGFYAARRDWDSALPLYRELLAARRDDPQINLTYGMGLLATRQYRSALEPLSKATASVPSNGEAGLAYARALKGAEEYDQAERQFDRIIPLFDSNAVVHREFGDFLFEKKDYGKAEKQYRTAYELQPNDAEAQLRLARLLMAQKEWTQAAEVYALPSVVRLSTDEDRKQYIYALLNSGQRNRAEAALKEALSANKLDFDLRLQLAGLYAARRDWDSALPLYRELLAARRDDPQINLTYGMGLLATRQYQPALEPLSKATASLQGNGEAGLAYARALKGAEEYDQAERQFDRIIPLLDSNAAVHREFGDFLFEKKDYGKAEKQYRTAYDLGLRDTRLLVGLSGALRAQHKPMKALPYLEQAYKLEPTDRLGFELATVLHQVGQDRRASELISKLERTPAQSSTQ